MSNTPPFSVPAPARPLGGRTHAGSVDADVWVSVGRSAAPDPVVAVSEALAQALPASASEPPGLLVVFVASSLDREQVAESITRTAPGIPTIGCTGRALISGRPDGDDTVVVLALGGADVTCTTAAAPIVDGDARAAAAAASRCALDLPDAASTLMIALVDGAGVDPDDVVRGAYDTVGPTIPLVGGCAAADTLGGDVALFHRSSGGRAVAQQGGAVVVAAIATSGRIGIGVAHGCRPVTEPMVVTSSDGRTVSSLDEVAALDAYLARHGLDESILDDASAFEAAALRRPLGIVRRGRVEPRSVLGADGEHRALECAGSVTPGGLVWLMDSDAESVLDAVGPAAAAALAGAGGRSRAVMAFDCGARAGILGADGMREEVGRLVDSVGCPVAGLYTFGEIARTTGTSGFHHHTVVLVAFG